MCIGWLDEARHPGRRRPGIKSPGGKLLKTIVCRCEDLTLDDCQHAIDAGYRCFEDLKRFLGLATGPCQGKACVQVAMQLIADRTGVDLDDVDVMTFRPPVRPIEFRTLAGGEENP